MKIFRLPHSLISKLSRLSLLACALLFGSAVETKADALQLGSAADRAVLYIATGGSNPINMSNPQGSVTENVGLRSSTLYSSDVNITRRVAFYGPVGATGSSPASVPEPMTMLLLGTGMSGIAATLRRRRKAGFRETPPPTHCSHEVPCVEV
jgi:hypothetical protein